MTQNGNSDHSLLTVREVADMLRIHPNTVRMWNNRGLIKAYRLGSRGDRRFSQQEILEFLARQGIEDTTVPPLRVVN